MYTFVPLMSLSNISRKNLEYALFPNTLLTFSNWNTHIIFVLCIEKQYMSFSQNKHLWHGFSEEGLVSASFLTYSWCWKPPWRHADLAVWLRAYSWQDKQTRYAGLLGFVLRAPLFHICEDIIELIYFCLRGTTLCKIIFKFSYLKYWWLHFDTRQYIRYLQIGNPLTRLFTLYVSAPGACTPEQTNLSWNYWKNWMAFLHIFRPPDAGQKHQKEDRWDNLRKVGNRYCDTWEEREHLSAWSTLALMCKDLNSQKW